MITPIVKTRFCLRNILIFLYLGAFSGWSFADALDHWTAANIVSNFPNPYGVFFTGLTYGNSHYVGIGQYASAEMSFAQTSSDGMNWSKSSFSPLMNLSDVAFNDGTFVAVGGFGVANIWHSDDGNTWTGVTSDMGFSRVITGGNLFVAVGGGQTNRQIFTSPDGITWTSRTSGSPITDVHPIPDVAYGAGLFVAVDAAQHFYTSSGGLTWTRRTNSYFAGRVNFANGLFIAPVSAGSNLLSSDGISWGLATNNTAAIFKRIIYVAGYYLAISDTNLFTSVDATNWVKRNLQLPATAALMTVTAGERNAIVAGYRLSGLGTSPIAFLSDPFVELTSGRTPPVQLTLSGVISRSYRIEYITDLPSSGWLTATTFVLSNSPVFWTDNQATNLARSYRAVLLP